VAHGLHAGVTRFAIDASVVASGWAAEQPAPRLTIFFMANNVFAIALALSPVGGWFSRSLPIAALVGFQAFRLPLELVLHDWASTGVIPQTMTWTGQNFDIIAGIAALAAAMIAGRSVVVGWAFNLFAFALLVNVIRVVALSSPLPFAWPLAQPLQLPFHLPYALIVPGAVGAALAGHVVLTRALLHKSSAPPA